MKIKELIERLGEYPDDWEITVAEEMNGTRRTTGEELTLRAEDGQVVIVRDIEGT